MAQICETCGATQETRSKGPPLVSYCDCCSAAPELYARRDHKVYAWGTWLTGPDAVGWYKTFHTWKPGLFAVRHAIKQVPG